jgi:hypothetical protein
LAAAPHIEPQRALSRLVLPGDPVGRGAGDYLEAGAMSDIVCVCGCTEQQHHVLHEHSHYPESRTVDQWEACEAHGCMSCRPVLPWPDADGLWWCDGKGCGDIVQVAAIDTGVMVRRFADARWTYRGDFERWYGPARFTKLLEPNPFEK